MADGQNELLPLIDIALAVVKDVAMDRALKRVEDAQRQFLIAQADANRKMSTQLIQAMRRLDIEKIQLQMQLSQMKSKLTPEAVKSIQAVIDCMDQKRNHLVSEKNRLK